MLYAPCLDACYALGLFPFFSPALRFRSLRLVLVSSPLWCKHSPKFSILQEVNVSSHQPKVFSLRASNNAKPAFESSKRSIHFVRRGATRGRSLHARISFDRHHHRAPSCLNAIELPFKITSRIPFYENSQIQFFLFFFRGGDMIIQILDPPASILQRLLL